jgi:tRNA(His) guanylyltransferase
MKIVSTVVSLFSVNYALLWPTFFPDKPLSQPFPTFDGREVQYPTVKTLRDYLRWRQADCEFPACARAQRRSTI